MTKHAIITGASRGIGSAISEHLAEKNYALHLISKNKNNLKKAFDKITKTSKETVETHSLDLNNPNKVTLFCRETLPSIPVPDVFVANAGILHAGTLNTTTEDLQASYQVNVLSTITLCNAVCERMKTKGGGHIFILGSNAACIHRESVGIYSSTKAAIGHYAQTLFNTMILHNVKVTCLCPSLVNTDMIREGLTFDPDDVIQTDDIVKTIDWVMSLSPGAAIPSVRIRCTPKEKELATLGCG